MDLQQQAVSDGTDPAVQMIWNISSIMSNVACAPFIRAATVRQVYRTKKCIGWRPLALVLSDEEGALAGWRGYLARGLTLFASDFYNTLMGDVNRFDNWFSFLCIAPLTSLVLTPFNAIQAYRTLDLGIPQSAARSDRWRTADEKEKAKVQKYDGIWDIMCQIWEKDGILGFYRGWLPCTLKLWIDDLHLLQWIIISNVLQSEDFDGILNLAHAFSVELVTYPWELLIQRQMVDFGEKDLSLLERIKKIWEKEGILGFYNGFFSYDYIVGRSAETVMMVVLAFGFSALL